jgi:hypothetical protein
MVAEGCCPLKKTLKIKNNHLNILTWPKKKPSADVMYEIIYSIKKTTPKSPLNPPQLWGGGRDA